MYIRKAKIHDSSDKIAEGKGSSTIEKKRKQTIISTITAIPAVLLLVIFIVKTPYIVYINIIFLIAQPFF